MNKIYKLADGRMWHVEKACYIDQAMSLPDTGAPDLCAEVIDLLSASGQSDQEYLIRTLLSSGYPLGELTLFSPEGIRNELEKLDREYLTPRTLAGLATGDGEALARWQSHEEKAAPLREKLAELSDISE